MNQKALIFGAVALLAIALGALLLLGNEETPAAPVTTENTPAAPASGVVAPSASVVEGTEAESIVSELFSEADADAALVADPATDAAAVRSDSAALSDFGNAYDETAF